MRKFVDFINRKKLWFAVGNIVLSVGFLFMPAYFLMYSNGFGHLFDELILFAHYLSTNDPQTDIAFRADITALFVFVVIAVTAIIVATVLCFVFRKFNITLIMPSLIITLIMLLYPIELSVLAGVNYYIPSVGFYLAVLIFAFYLTYFVADLYFKLKDRGRSRPPKEKKLSDKEHIARLEEELLRLKKDDA